jgi:hypothetical protein
MRKLLITLAGATALTAASAANATTFTGSTLGCFGGGCTVANASAPPIPNGGISFTGGTFNEGDSGGFLSIGTDATANSLGLISLTGIPESWVNVPFSLQVTFTAPPGTSPNPTLYSALLNGSVSTDGSCTGGTDPCGGAQFVFSNPLQTFTYAGGTFTLLVNNLSVSPGATNVPLTGTIRVTATNAVPEPATWALMLLGFGGIGMAMRRRRRPVLAQIA